MKTVIELAREANIKQAIETPHLLMVNELERLVELARADEREACARFLESTNLAGLPEDTALHYARLLKGFAEGIRARGTE